MTDTTALRLATATQRLLPFAAGMVAANLVLQLGIALTGGRIGVLAGVLTGVIALVYAVFLVRWAGALSKVRFGLLAAHTITYAAVNVGYGVHFFIRAVATSPTIRPEGSTEPGFVMDPGWFGVVLGMPTIWGLGLLVHAIGAVAGRGFEAGR